MTTPNLGLPQVPEQVVDISVAYNAAMKLIDMLTQMSVIDTLTAPPTTVAGDIGKRWLIGLSATGVWAGKDNQIALCVGANLWSYYTKDQVPYFWHAVAKKLYHWDTSSWTMAAGIEDAPIDDEFYGRKNALWVQMPDLSNPVLTVNGVSPVATALSLPAESVPVSIPGYTADDVKGAIFETIKQVSSRYIDPRYMRYWYHDYSNGYPTASTATGTSFVNTTDRQTYNTGTGAAWSAVTHAKYGQILQMTTGTTATGQCAAQITKNSQNLAVGKSTYEIGLRILTLSTSAQRYSFRAGLATVLTGAEANGVFAYYDDSVNSGNWVLRVINNSVTTNFNTSVPVTVDDVLLRVEVLPNGQATLFINGASAVSTAAAAVKTDVYTYSPLFRFTKMVGTTAVTSQLLFHSFQQIYSSPL